MPNEKKIHNSLLLFLSAICFIFSYWSHTQAEKLDAAIYSKNHEIKTYQFTGIPDPENYLKIIIMGLPQEQQYKIISNFLLNPDKSWAIINTVKGYKNKTVNENDWNGLLQSGKLSKATANYYIESKDQKNFREKILDSHNKETKSMESQKEYHEISTIALGVIGLCTLLFFLNNYMADKTLCFKTKGGLIMNMYIPMFITSLFLFYAAAEGFYSDGMYTLLRIFVCALSAIMAFSYYEKNEHLFTWGFIIIAVLFNPFIEIHFHRDTWEIINSITGIIFIVVAYIDMQEKKQASEVYSVFDRMYPDLDRSKIPTELASTLANLMAQDMETLAKGEIPERRLFLADAIKRDIILLGYHKDFYALPQDTQDLNKKDFDQQIYAINRLTPSVLDKLLILRKNSHNDLDKLEKEVRKTSIFDKHVPPIFYQR